MLQALAHYLPVSRFVGRHLRRDCSRAWIFGLGAICFKITDHGLDYGCVIRKHAENDIAATTKKSSDISGPVIVIYAEGCQFHSGLIRSANSTSALLRCQHMFILVNINRKPSAKVSGSSRVFMNFVVCLSRSCLTYSDFWVVLTPNTSSFCHARIASRLQERLCSILKSTVIALSKFRKRFIASTFRASFHGC